MITKNFVRATILGLSILFSNIVYSQTEDSKEKPEKEFVAYSIFYNVVNDNFDYPLIGLINFAKGNHKTTQLGFVNINLKNFSSLQAGFINTTIGRASGVQLGFLNTVLDSVSGVQLGFINTALKDLHGLQGGFLNITNKIRGTQLGFLNIADTISDGIPIGFLSYVRKGGYRSIEVSMSELYPINLTFKIGIPKLYTFIQGSYNSNYKDRFGAGFGFGSLIRIAKQFYFNPEAALLLELDDNDNSLATTFATNFKYSLNSNFQFTVGTSLVWLNYDQSERTFNNPFFELADIELDNRNSLLIGLRFGLSYNFTNLN